jgi:hypothetical protein
MTDKQFLIEAKMEANEYFLYCCILVLYARQESDEQDVADTHHQNGEGFNKSDAPFLSLVAEQLMKDYPIPPSDVAEARKRMKKYAGQLTGLIDDNEF